MSVRPRWLIENDPGILRQSVDDCLVESIRYLEDLEIKIELSSDADMPSPLPPDAQNDSIVDII